MQMELVSPIVYSLQDRVAMFHRRCLNILLSFSAFLDFLTLIDSATTITIDNAIPTESIMKN